MNKYLSLTVPLVGAAVLVGAGSANAANIGVPDPANEDDISYFGNVNVRIMMDEDEADFNFFIPAVGSNLTDIGSVSGAFSSFSVNTFSEIRDVTLPFPLEIPPSPPLAFNVPEFIVIDPGAADGEDVFNVEQISVFDFRNLSSNLSMIEIVLDGNFTTGDGRTLDGEAIFSSAFSRPVESVVAAASDDDGLLTTFVVSLTARQVEQVPEPTTLAGLALALGAGFTTLRKKGSRLKAK